jgi:predicted esterase
MLSPGGFFYRKISAARRAMYLSRAVIPFEPVRYVGHVAPASIFQHGTRDPSFSRANQQRLDRSASSAKKARYYNSGHDLNARAVADRNAWLTQELRLSKP